jgi:putative Mg2+ transporter-C (MgtC) family protein
MPSPPGEPVLIGRIAVAAVLGAAVGLERLLRGTGIGPRTLSLVCVGAASFTSAGFAVLGLPGAQAAHYDPTRIAAQVASGIGFLGAGIIFVSAGRVRGITTAADVWVVAAIGLLCGIGFLLTAAAVTAFVLVIVGGLRPLTRLVERVRDRSAGR